MAELLNIISSIKKEEGKNFPENSSRWLIEKLQRPNEGVQQIGLNDMTVGKFYFLMYDLSGKSSKLEQYSPILFVDFKHVFNTKILFGLSINFIPARLRILFFDKLLDSYPKALQPTDSKDKKGQPEQPLKGINFENVYNMLSKVGYEYAIREFDIRLVNKVYEVSMINLPRFLSINTQAFTNVDDAKLAQIWLAKLKTREERHQKLLLDIASGYDKVEKSLNEEFESFKEKMKNLEESMTYLSDLAKKKR